SRATRLRLSAVRAPCQRRENDAARPARWKQVARPARERRDPLPEPPYLRSLFDSMTAVDDVATYQAVPDAAVQTVTRAAESLRHDISCVPVLTRSVARRLQVGIKEPHDAHLLLRKFIETVQAYRSTRSKRQRSE